MFFKGNLYCSILQQRIVLSYRNVNINTDDYYYYNSSNNMLVTWLNHLQIVGTHSEET